MRSRHHLVFFNIVTSMYVRHGPNARNVINWKRNFKENIIKKYFGERKQKTQKNIFQFLNKIIS